MIELVKVNKIYNQGRANEVHALHDVDLTVAAGEMVCLKGASGSGKSTLLSIIGCVFGPTSGRAVIGGKPLSRLPDRFLTIHRRKTIGFIFQQFNLINSLTVLGNVCLPLLPLGVSPAERKERGEALLARFGLAHRAGFRADQISGGEMQRVAIARALINDPPIILADEPTAHLDTRLSRELMEILAGLKENGKTIVIASHDELVTGHRAIDRTVAVRDGRVVSGN